MTITPRTYGRTGASINQNKGAVAPGVKESRRDPERKNAIPSNPEDKTEVTMNMDKDSAKKVPGIAVKDKDSEGKEKPMALTGIAQKDLSNPAGIKL